MAVSSSVEMRIEIREQIARVRASSFRSDAFSRPNNNDWLATAVSVVPKSKTSEIR